jgi:hypothetical protein
MQQENTRRFAFKKRKRWLVGSSAPNLNFSLLFLRQRQKEKTRQSRTIIGGAGQVGQVRQV